ncbi:MAG: 50S ribosomal protein L10 [Verrucomicrobia bacterium]|nr:50S ribosomal protein L10 [Verrucomicrobiota bacterium]
MRAEKKYLVDEVGTHLDKSDYVFLTNFERITVEETGELRETLLKQGAEFHVVKNSVLDVAAKDRDLPDLEEWLAGPTAIVVGGNNPSGVAKALRKFCKDKDKNGVKVGVLGDKTLTEDDVNLLADLPTIEVLKAQLLSLFNTPATRMASVLNAVPTSMVNVLQARADQEENN